MRSRHFKTQHGRGRVMSHPVRAVPSGPAYDATGNFLSCVSGGLSLEIVRLTVYHNGSANDIAYAKPTGQHLTVSPAIVTEQRRKVAGVPGMRCSVWIKMTTCVWKAAAAAVITLVDMKCKEARLRIRQATYICDHQRPSTAWKEADRPSQLRMILASADMGYCGRPIVPYQNKSPHIIAMRCAVPV